ncbi:hypothetical protein ALQ55_200035 [Pseudomonas savastanoi pv. savastanoi]|nr:hypothetical protein ALQ55_200035 [Pseudomonas savastanoi pv. savastanoi]
MPILSRSGLISLRVVLLSLRFFISCLLFISLSLLLQECLFVLTGILHMIFRSFLTSGNQQCSTHQQGEQKYFFHSITP